MADKEYIARGAALLALTNDGCTVSNVCALMNVPAADVVEVKRGHWIEHRVGRWESTWECSECGTLGSPQWKCCPVCTAFMDRKGESDG